MKYYTRFDTEIGLCALAWENDMLIYSYLPRKNIESLNDIINKNINGVIHSTEIPDWVEKLMREIQSHINGDLKLFDWVKLSTDKYTNFQKSVWNETCKIPAGKTLSYKEIAININSPNSARAVGQALGSNPFPIIVPCHRVLAMNKKIGGFSAYDGQTTKRKLLTIEGVDTSLIKNYKLKTSQKRFE